MAIAAGVSQEQIESLTRWEQSGLFDEAERLSVRCAEEVHDLGVTDETFAALEDALGRVEAIEIVLTASFYQAVARIVQGLGVEVEPEYAAYLDDFAHGSVE